MYLQLNPLPLDFLTTPICQAVHPMNILLMLYPIEKKGLSGFQMWTEKLAFNEQATKWLTQKNNHFQIMSLLVSSNYRTDEVIDTW